MAKSDDPQQEGYHKHITFLNGPFICLRAKLADIFTPKRQRDMLMLGVWLSRFNTANLMYVPTSILPLVNVQPNMFLHCTKSKLAASDRQMFFTPYVAVITRNGGAKRQYEHITGQPWLEADPADLPDYVDFDELPPNLRGSVEMSIRSDECLLLYTTITDMAARVQLGMLPYCCVPADQSAAFLNCAATKERRYEENDNEEEEVEEEEDDDDDDDDEDGGAAHLKESMIADCKWTFLHQCHHVDNPMAHIDVVQLRLDMTPPTPLSYMSTLQDNNATVYDRARGRTAKRSKTVPMALVANSQYIIQEIVESMCHMDTNQYMYGNLTVPQRLIAYTSLLIRSVSGGELASIMPNCQSKQLTASLLDVFMSLIIQQDSCRTYTEKKPELETEMMPLNGTMLVACTFWTNKTFINYTKQLEVRKYTTKDNKERISFNIVNGATKKDMYACFKESMGCMIGPITATSNYMRAAMIVNKKVNKTTLLTMSHAASFNHLAFKLNKPTPQLVQAFASPTTPSKSNAILMTRINNRTTDSILGNMSQTTEEGSSSSSKQTVKMFGPPYDALMATLPSELMTALTQCWTSDPAISFAKNYFNLAVRVIETIKTVLENQVTEKAGVDLIDLGQASTRKMDAVANYDINKALWGQGELGRTGAVSVSRLLEQKAYVICENTPQARRAVALKAATTSQFTGSTKTDTITTTAEKEAPLIRVAKTEQEYNNVTIPKEFSMNRAVIMRSKTNLITYADPSTDDAGAKNGFGVNVSAGTKGSSDEDDSHIEFVIKWLMNVIKKVFLCSTAPSAAPQQKLSGTVYYRMELEMRKTIKKPEMTVLRQALLPLNWRLYNEPLNLACTHVIGGHLCNIKGYVGNAAKYFEWKKHINHNRIQWMPRYIVQLNTKAKTAAAAAATAVQNDENDDHDDAGENGAIDVDGDVAAGTPAAGVKYNEDFELVKDYFPKVLRDSGANIECVHINWNKFMSMNGGYIERLQVVKPPIEHEFRFLLLGFQAEIIGAFSVNLVVQKGKLYAREDEPQFLASLMTALEKATVDGQLDIIHKNLDFFRGLCEEEEKEEEEEEEEEEKEDDGEKQQRVKMDTVMYMLETHCVDLYMYNRHLVNIIYKLLRGETTESIKMMEWYQELVTAEKSAITTVTDDDMDAFAAFATDASKQETTSSSSSSSAPNVPAANTIATELIHFGED